MLRVTAYTGGHSVPSARFRVRQYIASLRQYGVEMKELPARFGSYPPARRALRPAWGVLALAERFAAATASHQSDLTLLQREMLSTLATVERFTKAPRVFDVDDAIWLLRGGRSASSLARLSDLVICGNSNIAEFFEGRVRTAILPTPVDTERFRPLDLPTKGATRVICWSGTSSGFRFLHSIETEIAAVLRAGSNRRLRIVSDARPVLRSIPAERVEFVRWSPENEVAAIQDADVAVMPLNDSPWARGKCSYKLLTYMACGVPVIATPAGMNAQVLAGGQAGISARTPREWTDALEFLVNRPESASAMGVAGRQLVLREYSLHALAPRLAAILQMTKAAAN